MRDKYSYVASPVPASTLALAPRVTALHGYIVAYFAALKTERKQAAATAATALATAVTAGNALPAAFRTHGQAHLAIGTLSRAQMLVNLQAFVKQRYDQAYPAPAAWGVMGASAAAQLVQRATVEFGPAAGGTWTVRIQLREPKTAAPIALGMGTVYTGADRFVALGAAAQPAGRENDVYVRQGFPNQHYVRYTRSGANRYVRRYVMRGLNQGDSVNVTAAAALEAPEQTQTALNNEIRDAEYTGRHNLAVGADLTDEQKILSHTRGWKKRFISTTTTFHPAYSTRGEEFRSVFGKVIIDLAHVPGADIFDLHTPDALAIFNTTAATVHATDVDGRPTHRSLHDEELLAARDVIRTRELLIHGTVPDAAVLHSAAVQSIIGIFHPSAGVDNGNTTFALVEAAWAAHPRTATETLSYPWQARWYRFYKFANAGAAAAAWAVIPAPQQTRRQYFNEYDFPAPTPLGFDR